MSKTGNFLKFSLSFIIGAAILFSADFISAAKGQRQGDDILLGTYYQIKTKLERNSFGVPLYIESSDNDGRLHADVYGVFNHPYSSILDMLKVPANWCDVASLHPNVKACTYRELPDTWRLTFYGGRKVYQSPDDAYQFTYDYKYIEQRSGYLNVVLTAGEGPFGTKDHRMRFEAIPLDEARTFVHVGYDYSYGSSLRFAEKIYFATLGRGKVGFTVSGTDSKGNPVYIGGPRGAIERNAVRYYCAIQSFMDTLRYPEERRFTMRISAWYDLTSRYKKQLFEMDKKDYLAFKTGEHQNQVMLQQRTAITLQ
jgi:hypothetical protein